MVAKEVEDFISSAALRYGQRSNGFICFEQDTDEDIVLRELLDKKLWDIPDRVRDRAAFEERINNALREHHPEYWRVWENRRKYAPTIKISPGHNER